MSAVNVVTGQTVKLDVLIEGAGSGVFPRAVLLDEDNSPLTVSPLNLSHVQGDLYSGTFEMPDTEKVTAITTVYEDAGYTTVDEDYPQDMAEYITQSGAGSVAGLIAKIEQLILASSGIIRSQAQSIEIDIKNENIEVCVEPSDTSIC